MNLAFTEFKANTFHRIQLYTENFYIFDMATKQSNELRFHVKTK